MAEIASVALWRDPRGSGVAPESGRWYLALDPDTGQLYPTDEATDIRLRDGGAGHLYPTDDTALTAARTAIVGTGATAIGEVY